MQQPPPFPSHHPPSQTTNPLQKFLPTDLDPALRRIRGAFQSALNLNLYRPTTYAGHHHAPACPLPINHYNTRRALCEAPVAIGHGTDDWCRHSARYIMNTRGQKVFVQEWVPLGSRGFWGWLRSGMGKKGVGRKRCKGVVVLVHGLNGHSGNYVEVAKGWVENGFAVVGHDLHGHGRSEGVRAYAKKLEDYVEDARLCVRDAERRFNSGGRDRKRRMPMFLLGHSLGGAIAIHLARDDPMGQCCWNGIMLTAPAVKVYPKPLLKMFAPIIASLVPMLPVQKLHFDKKKKGAEMVDPLMVKSPVRARLGYEVLKSCEKIMREAGRFEIPSFVAHSKSDRVTNAKGSIDFVKRIASEDKTLKLYNGDTHDLLNGKKDVVLMDMVRWANKRLDQRTRCRIDDRRHNQLQRSLLEPRPA